MQADGARLAFLQKWAPCPRAENRVLQWCKLFVKNIVIRHKDRGETTNVFVQVYNKFRKSPDILRKCEAMVNKKRRKVYNFRHPSFNFKEGKV